MLYIFDLNPFPCSLLQNKRTLITPELLKSIKLKLIKKNISKINETKSSNPIKRRITPFDFWLQQNEAHLKSLKAKKVKEKSSQVDDKDIVVLYDNKNIDYFNESTMINCLDDSDCTKEQKKCCVKYFKKVKQNFNISRCRSEVRYSASGVSKLRKNNSEEKFRYFDEHFKEIRPKVIKKMAAKKKKEKEFCKNIYNFINANQKIKMDNCSNSSEIVHSEEYSTNKEILTNTDNIANTEDIFEDMVSTISPNIEEKFSIIFKNNIQNGFDCKSKNTKNASEGENSCEFILKETPTSKTENLIAEELKKIVFKSSKDTLENNNLEKSSTKMHCLEESIINQINLLENERKMKKKLKFSSFIENKSISEPDVLPDIVVRSFEQEDETSISIRELKYWTESNHFCILPKIRSKTTDLAVIVQNIDNNQLSCQRKFLGLKKLNVTSLCTMSSSKLISPEQTFERVYNWISNSDFMSNIDCSRQDKEDLIVETNLVDKLTDITSVTKQFDRNQYGKILTEKRTEVIKFLSEDSSKNSETNLVSSNHQLKSDSAESISMLVKNLKSEKNIKTLSKLSTYSPWEIYHGRLKSCSEPLGKFSTIAEGEETVRFSLFYLTLYFILILLPLIFYDYTVSFFFAPY